MQHVVGFYTLQKPTIQLAWRSRGDPRGWASRKAVCKRSINDACDGQGEATCKLLHGAIKTTWKGRYSSARIYWLRYFTQKCMSSKGKRKMLFGLWIFACYHVVTTATIFFGCLHSVEWNGGMVECFIGHTYSCLVQWTVNSMLCSLHALLAGWLTS